MLFEDRKCEICNNTFHVSKKSKQRFCSTKCQAEWQKTNVGINNSRFKGEVINCDWCGKPFARKKAALERYNNHFCCKECYLEWNSKVNTQSQECRDRQRKVAISILESKPSNVQTKPQLIINQLLDAMGISYINEKSITYYSLDNYLQDYNLAIEIMGDFWHANPIIYPEIKQEIQKKRIPKDKAKHTFVKNTYSYEILYLWESDICKNIKLCEMLIKKYIDCNGILDNYHSFNYYMLDEEICLRPDIIYSHFDNVA